MSSILFLSDKELAAVVGCSTRTIKRVVNGQFKANKSRDSLCSVKPVYVGGARRWNIHDISKAIGVSVENIKEFLS